MNNSSLTADPIVKLFTVQVRSQTNPKYRGTIVQTTDKTHAEEYLRNNRTSFREYRIVSQLFRQSALNKFFTAETLENGRTVYAPKAQS